jgi:hypothetical protein
LTSDAQSQTQNDSAQPTPSISQNAAVPPDAGASVPLAVSPDTASDSAVISVQASLAADSQQVKPVLHYAP